MPVVTTRKPATATPAKRGPGRPPKAPQGASVPPPAPPKALRAAGPTLESIGAKMAAGKALTLEEARALAALSGKSVSVGKPGAPMATPPGVRPAGLRAPNAAPPAPPVDVTALQATITKQSAEIVKLQETITALKAKPATVRSVADIVGDEEHPATNGLRDDDWRLGYHGVNVATHQYTSNGKTGVVETIYDGAVTEDETAYQTGHGEAMPPIAALLAIPRSNDVGGKGTQARAQGLIALHYVQNEDGDYEGQPEYLTEADLAAVWIEQA